MNLGLNRISFGKIRKLDRGSIRSSPRFGLNTPNRMAKEQCWTVPQVRMMMFSLNMVDYSMSFL